MLSALENVDLTKIIEEDDNTDLKGEAACAGVRVKLLKGKQNYNII